MTAELAVIEAVVTELRNPLPVLRFYKGKELDNDAANFFTQPAVPRSYDARGGV
jgi:hypothetical protein